MRIICFVLVLAHLAFAGCARNHVIGKPTVFVDSAGNTNIVQYREIVTGGAIGARQSIIVAEVIKGQAPTVIGSASAQPLAQSVLGPVSIAAGYVWGQSARRPDKSGGNTASASSEGGAGGSAAVEIHDDPPAPPKGGKPPWGNGRGKGPKD